MTRASSGTVQVLRRALACAAPACFLLILGACEGLDVQPGATSILEVFAEPTVAQAADWSMDKYDANKRYRGTMILANKPFAGEELYLKLFIDNATDPDSGVRTAAIRALGNHGGPEHAPVLIKALQDQDKLVRLEAARALQRVHSASAVDALIKATKPNAEAEAQIRAEAAEALGQYAENRVLGALQECLPDSDLTVNFAALRSLRTLTGQDFGFDRVAWHSWINGSPDPFKARLAYVYPVFRREKSFVEYVPFVPGPPNEPEGSTPAGLPTPGETGTAGGGDKNQPTPPK